MRKPHDKSNNKANNKANKQTSKSSKTNKKRAPSDVEARAHDLMHERVTQARKHAGNRISAEPDQPQPTREVTRDRMM